MQTEVEFSELAYDDKLPAEEVDLTFQIGMVGSDGVLLATDLKRTHVDARRGVYRSSSQQPKLHIEKDVAYCCSGDELTEVAARMFCETTDGLVDDSGMHDRLIAAAQGAMSQEKMSRQHGSLPLSGGSALFVHRRESGKVQLWCLEMSPYVDASPRCCAASVHDHVINGDRGNPAGFFIEHYFPKRRRMPIQDLIPLVAHTVLIAGVLNPAGIGGLEMLRCTSAGFKKVSERDIAALTKRSEELDAAISASLRIGGKAKYPCIWPRWLRR